MVAQEENNPNAYARTYGYIMSILLESRLYYIEKKLDKHVDVGGALLSKANDKLHQLQATLKECVEMKEFGECLLLLHLAS